MPFLHQHTCHLETYSGRTTCIPRHVSVDIYVSGYKLLVRNMFPGDMCPGVNAAYIYVDGHMLLDTSCSSGILVDCILATFFMSWSTCIPLNPATDRRQTDDSFVAVHVDGDKLIQVDTTCIRQHVSWCKCGLNVFFFI